MVIPDVLPQADARMEPAMVETRMRRILATAGSRHWGVIVPGALVVVLLPLLVAACGAGGESSQKAIRGGELFEANCALCHGQVGEGKPMLGKDLRDNDFAKTMSDEELVDFLRIGRPADHPLNDRGMDMPPKGGNPALTDEDLALIVAFLRTLT